MALITASSLSVSKSCSVSCTALLLKATFWGFQQVELPSHLQNSEQASYAAEKLHICQEPGMSLRQIQTVGA